MIDVFFFYYFEFWYSLSTYIKHQYNISFAYLILVNYNVNRFLFKFIEFR